MRVNLVDLRNFPGRSGVPTEIAYPAEPGRSAVPPDRLLLLSSSLPEPVAPHGAEASAPMRKAELSEKQRIIEALESA